MKKKEEKERKRKVIVGNIPETGDLLSRIFIMDTDDSKKLS